MNDVSFARSPRWVQWLFVAVQAVAYRRPILITAGRRSELLDAKAMVDTLHERMLEERRTAPRRPTRLHVLPGGTVRIEIDVRDEPAGGHDMTQPTAHDTSPSHRISASTRLDQATGEILIELPDGWIESIGWGDVETVDIRVAEDGSVVVSRID